MSSMGLEMRMIMRSRLSVVALLLLLALSITAVWSGLHEVSRQKDTIARMAPLQAGDVAAVAERYGEASSAGNPAYYTFFNTWDAPSDTAFMALGMRDVAPYVLRIRALALQAQLHDGENFNPELALPGRFDFAFVLIYLAPLFVIALLHDLVSSERESGRLRMLLALPATASRVWPRRVALRYTLLLLCLTLPLVVGAAVANAAWQDAAITLLVVIAYLAVWTGLSVLVAAKGWRSAVNATMLMACWTMLTLVLPTVANMALSHGIPVHQGIDLMLAQRDKVHGAWEVSKEATMQTFAKRNPEWAASAAVPAGFRWKWYFAFQQNGDDSVAEQFQAYRHALAQRQAWTQRLGWLLPGVGAQAVLHRVARTDLDAQLAYQNQIIHFHHDIRRFYYGYLFNDRPFGKADYAKIPVFTPGTPAHVPLLGNAAMLVLMGIALMWWALSRVRKIKLLRAG